MSQPGTKELQEDHDEEGCSHNASLNAVFSLSACLCCPVDLVQDVSYVVVGIQFYRGY